MDELKEVKTDEDAVADPVEQVEIESTSREESISRAIAQKYLASTGTSLNRNSLLDAVTSALAEFSETVKTIPDGMVSVKCILNRESHADTLYDTGVWSINETKLIPRNIARQMLKHADVYCISDEPATEEVAEKANALADNSKTQETYDQINAMPKDSLKAFIKMNFNQDVDLRKHPNVATLQAFARQLTDQYGLLP